jgi:flagellar protein FlgJ
MQSAAMYNDFGNLATLRLEARQDAQGALAEVASQFESLFLQMMLKSMRDAVPEGGLFGSEDMKTYRGMHDQQLALDMSAQGGIGLADVLVRQLQGGELGRGEGGAGTAQAAPDAASATRLREAYTPDMATTGLKLSSTWSLTT